MAAGYTPGQLPVDADVFRVEVVGDAHFGGDGLCAFVDGEGGDMGVLVDDPGGEPFTGAVDDLGGARIESFADLCDLPRLYEYIGVGQPAFIFVCPDGCVFDEQVMLGREAIPAIAVEGVEHSSDAVGAPAGRAVGHRRGRFCKSRRPDNEVSGGVGAVAVPGVAVDDAAEPGCG